MHIASFHIDGFGVLSQVGVEQLPQGLSVFLGKNEAGKSTCLDFFRTMLTGYPQTRSKKADIRDYTPLSHAGQAGGFLSLQTENHGIIRLTRRPQKGKDDLILTDANGQILDASILDNILAGVTREVYRNVFGFSLNELQAFSSLDSEGIRDALYGASFGMGLLPPGMVLKKLQESMNKHFKSSGTVPTLNVALNKLEIIQREIHKAHATCARFDTLTLEKNKLEQVIQDIREQKNTTEGLRRDAERQLGVWRQWDEWRTTENRLSRLEHVQDSFPEDGPSRLERAQELRQDASRRVHTQEERCQKLQESINGLQINPKLLQEYALLQSLSERKTSFRQAQSALAPQNAALQRSQAALEQYLADLGPDWTCERIRKTDRSLFARGEMESQATDMQAAEQTHLAATHALEKANAAVEHAAHEHALAKNTLEHLPHPEAVLDDMGRESVRNSIAFIENTQNTLVEKQHAVQTATHALQRTLGPLQIRLSAHEDSKEAIQKLENLLENQGEALALADVCQQAQIITREAEHNANQVQESEDMARARLERAKKHSHENSTSPKSALDIRAKAVRGLRTLYSNFCAEKERLAELTERLNTSIAPAPVKSIPLMAFGLVVLALGLGGLIMLMHFGITEIQITPRLIIPLNQWSSYFVVLAGAALLAGGMPRSGPESKRYALEQKELEARASSMNLRLMEMEGNIQEQCVVAQVQGADNVTLDAVELLLEREREQYAANERLVVEIEGLEAELATISEKSKQKRELLAKAQTEEQQARHKWHNLLHAHNIQAIPAPDAATTFFARVEAAILAQNNLQALQEEVAQLKQQMADHTANLSQTAPIQELLVPPVVERLEQDAEGQELEQEQPVVSFEPTLQDILHAAKRVLENCREADETQAERLKAEALIHNAKYNQELAGKSQAEAMEELNSSEQNLSTARAAWIERLQELNMDAHVSPTMLRTALDSMERCLAVELELASIQEEKQRLEHECEALVKPLTSILGSMGKDLPLGAAHDLPYQEDWLGALDNLLFEAQNTYDNSKLKEQYKQQLVAQEEELHEANTAFSDAKATEEHLLHLAGTNNVEDFLRMATVRAQRNELLQRKADLEDALRLAAGENSFEDFLQSFTKTDQHEREVFINDMQNNLDALSAEDQEKSTALAAINAELNTLTATDELANLRQQESDLQASIQSTSNTWAAQALARQLILQAKQRYESERQPQVIRMASDIFSKITAGRWQGITAQLEESSLQVFPPHGAPTSPLNLSRGTQEQLYLALRLAYIQQHSEHATVLPVIMDDILVNFDPDRARQTAKALLGLSQGNKGHQILFFTCHPHIADMLQGINPDSQRFLVEGGNIKSA